MVGFQTDGPTGGTPWPENTKAKYRYESYQIEHTQPVVISEAGPTRVTSPMGPDGSDYKWATTATWLLDGSLGHTWEIKINYLEIDFNVDVLASGPGEA